MLSSAKPFSSFSVDEVKAAAGFYRDTLGLEVTEIEMGPGLLTIDLVGGGQVFVYAKGADHAPASHTVLNFQVDDIDAAVDGLTAAGVAFERIEGFEHDEKGIARGGGDRGPSIAWFTDPAGNTLAVLEQVGR